MNPRSCLAASAIGLLSVAIALAANVRPPRPGCVWKTDKNCLVACGCVDSSCSECRRRQFKRWFQCEGWNTEYKCTMNEPTYCVWENFHPEAPGVCTCAGPFVGTSYGAIFDSGKLTPC